MTTQDTSRSYDDLPESDVATVLQVPLLWSPRSEHSAPRSSDRRDERGGGRHRAPGPGTHSRPRERRSPAGRRRRGSPPAAPQHQLAATARIGLISAALVLGLFAAALLALAVWLP